MNYDNLPDITAVHKMCDDDIFNKRMLELFDVKTTINENHLTSEELLNYKIQLGILNIIDELDFNNLEISDLITEFYDKLNACETEFYKDKNITLLLLNTLVKTFDKDLQIN